MSDIINLLLVILTMEELIGVRCIFLVGSFIAGLVLCKLFSKKIYLAILALIFLLIVFGEFVFWNGSLVGWVIIVVCLPTFIGFLLSVVVYYFIGLFNKKTNNSNE